MNIDALCKLALLFLVGLLLGGCQESGNPYQTTGIVSSRVFHVTAPRGGELKRLYVAEGEKVKKGQWIAKISGQKTFKAPDVASVMETFYLQKEYVPAGSAIVSLLISDEKYILCYIPEENLNRIQVDKVVTIRYRDHDYPAQIKFIAPAAEYTPDSLYQEENRHKSVFKVKTEMPKKLSDMVKVGQAVEVIYD